jgi:hypothetical protein
MKLQSLKDACGQYCASEEVPFLESKLQNPEPIEGYSPRRPYALSSKGTRPWRFQVRALTPNAALSAATSLTVRVIR